MDQLISMVIDLMIDVHHLSNREQDRQVIKKHQLIQTTNKQIQMIFLIINYPYKIRHDEIAQIQLYDQINEIEINHQIQQSYLHIILSPIQTEILMETISSTVTIPVPMRHEISIFGQNDVKNKIVTSMESLIGLTNARVFREVVVMADVSYLQLLIHVLAILICQNDM
jgi:predicted transcriptional regulator